MNLLPRSHEEFGQAEYWDSFFKKRGEQAFEWYGEYLELCEPIHKYIKSNDKILMLGCGNSKLSMEMYDHGFRDIVNIDISAVAIKTMQELNSRPRADMKFLQMDATQMSFESEQFSVALDKGTLDALFTDDTLEVKQKIEKYFDEISRILRIGGRYLCISLLQEHILKYVVEYFPKKFFMLRIVHCWEAERANKEKNADNPDAVVMPVFAIVATKFKALPTTPILEFTFSSDRIQRVKSTLELENAVTSIQRAALVCNGLARSNISGHNEVTMELCTPGETTPRYTIHLLDQKTARGYGKYAAFIVPQGREVEWLFSTPEGRKKLQSSAKYQRLAVVTLHRDQVYHSLDTVKMELSENVKSLAPGGLKVQIPFLSLGSDVGRRETLVSGFSQISGDFRVEEVEGVEGKLFRRLIFLNNQFVIQSEALVKMVKSKGKAERKRIDFGYLACHHHLYMSVGVQMSTESQKPTDGLKNVLVVGLGGGSLCSFIHEVLPNTRVTAVEIDPIMLEVAEQYFDLKQDKRLHVVIDDGLAFLERCKIEGSHFNAVLFDVDSKDMTLGMSCPPPSFLAEAVLTNIKSIIDEKGLFILNLVCRDEVLRVKALKSLKNIFPAICTYKLDEDVNEVVYCTNNDKLKHLKNWKKMLGAAGRNLNAAVKTKKLSNDEMLDVTDFMSDLKL